MHLYSLRLMVYDKFLGVGLLSQKYLNISMEPHLLPNWKRYLNVIDAAHLQVFMNSAYTL